MDITIRPYVPRDAPDLADMFFRSVRQVAVRGVDIHNYRMAKTLD